MGTAGLPGRVGGLGAAGAGVGGACSLRDRHRRADRDGSGRADVLGLVHLVCPADVCPSHDL